MTERTKRVLVYTVALLAAPPVAIPFERGTPAFALSLVPCGLFIAAASVYVLRGELRLGSHSLLGLKLIVASVITFLFGAALAAGSVVYIFVNLF